MNQKSLIHVENLKINLPKSINVLKLPPHLHTSVLHNTKRPQILVARLKLCFCCFTIHCFIIYFYHSFQLFVCVWCSPLHFWYNIHHYVIAAYCNIESIICFHYFSSKFRLLKLYTQLNNTHKHLASSVAPFKVHDMDCLLQNMVSGKSLYIDESQMICEKYKDRQQEYKTTCKKTAL